MTGQSQPLKELLLQTDGEYHQLAGKHQELEGRLHELSSKPYLSEPEQLEKVTLKKRKLQLKDRMEELLRRRRQGDTSTPPSISPGVTPAGHPNAGAALGTPVGHPKAGAALGTPVGHQGPAARPHARG